jgi:tRNA-Thr(GGU) m(6)t(6)A37 methyltransferase TsaA
LADLEGFSHIILLYAFHQVREANLTVTPFLDTHPRGVFSTRAPKRPNPIGLSVVRLVSVSGNTLQIENIDILDGTPLLDIKPSIPDFDHVPVTSLGWYQQASQRVEEARADRRFSEED